MTPLLRSRIDEASRIRRSWVIGMQPVIARFTRMAVQNPRVRVVGHERFGKVYLIRLRGRPALSRSHDARGDLIE